MQERQEQFRVATVVMNALEQDIGQTLGFGVLNRAAQPPTVEVIAEVEGVSGFCFHMDVGFQIPLHTSAPGKAIMAFLPTEDCNRVIDQMSFEVFTESTISTPEAFRANLEQVRQQGYATDRNEQVLNCHCIGVPVHLTDAGDVGALWTTGPAHSIPEETFQDIARHLAEGARRIEAGLAGMGREMNAEYIDLVVDAAIQMVNTTLNRRLDMKQVAAELFVSYSWFRQAFKRRTGLSPNRYHMQRRMERAEQLLAVPGVYITEVAAQLGFADEAYFSARFKQKAGMSPRTYRDRLGR